MTRRLPLAVCAAALVVGFTHTALTDEAPASEPVAYFVEVEEDGSGVQYIRGEKVATFPEGMFEWDCAAMGNRTCGTEAAQR